MRFTKMHGLGNDYVFVNTFEERVNDPALLAVSISNRHTGVGSDGLVLIGPSSTADFKMTMFNSDGSRGAMCGNAARCVGRYVYERGLTKKTEFVLETDAGRRPVRLFLKDGQVASIQVDMGRPVTDCERVPCLLGKGMVLKAPITVQDRTFFATPISVGNPHAVILMKEPIESLDIGRYGPLLEHHPAFPQQVNIEWVNVLSPERLRMRVWERGSGETQACGTGACTALTAAHLCGETGKHAIVELPGGELDILLAEHLFMTGPAVLVFDGTYEEKAR